MKRRARKLTIEATGPEQSTRQPTISEQAATLRALMPTTSALDTDQPCPCYVCGGPVERSGPHFGPWRLHPGCQSVLGDPVSRLVAAGRALGRDLDRTDALLLPFTVQVYASGHPEPTWTDEPGRDRLPWRHVDRSRLDLAIIELPALRAEAGLDPNTCENGPCAWCGVREALGRWADRGHRWADGSPAPLCAACAVVFDRYGLSESSWWSDQRPAIAAAVTGVPSMMGEHVPPGLTAFAEVEEGGDGTPWSHLDPDALDRYRWAAWTRWDCRYAPPERRQEALARARADQAAWSAREAARQAEKAAQADLYGFEVTS